MSKQKFPSVDCRIIIHGPTNPLSYEGGSFYAEFRMKNLVMPKEFEVWKDVGDCSEVEAYIKEGEDQYLGEENWQWVSPEEEKEFIHPLPAPFNRYDAVVNLRWTIKEVAFDKAALALLQTYHHTFTEAELQEKTVDFLQVIAHTKKAKAASRKAEIIGNILAAEAA